IDLEERGVGLNECAIEALEKSDGMVDLRCLEAERKGQLARLPCAEADRRINGFFEDGFGSFGGNFFNLHAAGLRSHEDQATGGAVEDDAEVKLTIDGRGLFNEQPLHLLALRAGLVGHERHAKNL